MSSLQFYEYYASLPAIITLSIRLLPKEYGKYAIEGIGFVKIRFAFLPTVMLPTSFWTSIAQAPLTVAALIASSGNIFICMQLIATTRFILPDGEEPGLKSEASAIAAPVSISFLAG